jgi:uncharacterized membrane protein YvbJ
MKKNIINKLAEWETALNKIPVEKRQGFIIKTGIVLLILLFVFVIGGKMYRSHKRETKKENIELPVSRDMEAISEEVDKELSTMSSSTKDQTEKALRMLDSLTKTQKGDEK